MTSNKALNKIWDFIETHYNEKDDYPKNLYNILEDIEQKLDRLEKLKNVIEILKNKFEIEITKTFCPRIIITETNELENNDNVSEFLTQEEYELLKEYLYE